MQGVLTTLAIGVHNIPEGLAKATVLVGQGVPPRRALAWSVATCLPQPLVAIPSFMFVDAFTVRRRAAGRRGSGLTKGGSAGLRVKEHAFERS